MRLIACVYFVLLAQSLLFATRYYVSPNGSGDGSSWLAANSNLQKILLDAMPGDEIWVATGIYTPTDSLDRSASFVLKEGILLFGGFMGYESSPDQRNVQVNKSILSGEIGEAGPSDNVYTILFSENLTHATCIDGFILSGGNSDHESLEEGIIETSGAAWYNRYDGQNNKGWPIVKHLHFEDNFAYYGGAIYADFKYYSNFSVDFHFCTFFDNEALFYGGAFCIVGDYDDLGYIQFSNCTFKGNTAMYGGGLSIVTEVEKPLIKIDNCIFEENLADQNGGAIYCPGRITSNHEIELVENTFDKNFPRDIN